MISSKLVPLATACFVITVLAACGSDSSGTSTGNETVTCNDTGASTLDEGLIGDMSNDPNTPNNWALGAGVNELRAATSEGDLDYFRFVVGNCDTLDSVFVNAFTNTEGTDNVFIAIQQGSIFSVSAEELETNTVDLYGFGTFGTANLLQDILPQLGQASGTSGFTPPLQSGTYTVWLNRPGAKSEYTLGFNVSRVSE